MAFTHAPSARLRALLPGVLFAALALALLAPALWLGDGTRAFLRTAQAAPGRVSALAEGAGGYLLGPRPVVTYQAGGSTYQLAGSPVSSLGEWALGDQTRVLYQPGDPGAARIDSFVELWLVPASLGGLGLLFLPVAGLLFLLKPRTVPLYLPDRVVQLPCIFLEDGWEVPNPQPGTYAIRSDEELRRLWGEHGGRPGELPAINFKQQMLLLILGPAGGAGSSHRLPRIAALRLEEGRISVRYYLLLAPGWAVPVETLLVPRTDGPVVFEQVPASQPSAADLQGGA